MDILVIQYELRHSMNIQFPHKSSSSHCHVYTSLKRDASQWPPTGTYIYPIPFPIFHSTRIICIAEGAVRTTSYIPYSFCCDSAILKSTNEFRPDERRCGFAGDRVGNVSGEPRKAERRELQGIRSVDRRGTCLYVHVIIFSFRGYEELFNYYPRCVCVCVGRGGRSE